MRTFNSCVGAGNSCVVAGRHHAEPGGFTLIEVMAAMAILAVTFVVLLGLQQRDVVLQGYADRLTVATLLARERMMQFEMAGFPKIEEQAGEFLEEHQGYTWKASIASTPFGFVREVRVQVRWAGEAQGADLVAYLFKTS